MTTTKTTQIAVLGAGFAGLEFCKALNDAPVEITLIDRQNHHLFQPLLYQVATAGLAAPEIAHPVRSVFADQKNVSVLMDEVVSLDLKDRTVLCKERAVPYDYLVIGLGVKTGYFGHDEWRAHTRGLKTLDDATAMRRDLLMAFEKADACEDPEERARLMTTVIVGGGPTGVELAGALAELARHVLKRDFKRVDTSQAKIILVEMMPRLLSMYDETLSAYTEERLRAIGVTVWTGTRVKSIDEHTLELESQTVRAANIIWAAGVEAPQLTRTLGVETDPGGRLIVEKDLSLPGHPEVFAVGDIAHCIDQAGVRVPGLCPAAMQMGKHAARVILDDLERAKKTTATKTAYDVRPQFRYFDKGSMATIGRSAAVAESMGMKFKGIIAWLMWLFVHLMFLIGFRNKLAVMLQWFYSYVRYRNGARIITGVEIDRPPKSF